MEWGGGIAFRRVYPAQAYATVVVLVRLDIKMCLIEKITYVLFLAYLIDLNIPRLKRWQLQARNVFKWQKMTFDGRQPLTEDDLWLKTTFYRRQPLMEDDLWWKRTFDGIGPLTEDNLQWKTTFDRVFSISPEKNVYDSSPWLPQHNWLQTGNPISCLNRKKNFMWWKKCMRHRACVHKRRHF